MSEFKKCPTGHYYKSTLAQCPFCPGGGTQTTSNPGNRKTIPYGGGFGPEGPTLPLSPDTTEGGGSEIETIAFTKRSSEAVDERVNDSGKTQFGFEIEKEINGQVVKEVIYRDAMLVGWLVSYTIDKAGKSFELYEGNNNYIGQNYGCSIWVDNDKTVSGKHALILFREDDGYAIIDKESKTGTYVNGKSIGFSACKLEVSFHGQTLLLDASSEIFNHLF